MCWDLIGLLLLVRRFASRKQLSYLVSLFQKLLPNWNFINCYEIEISKHKIFYSAGPGHDSELKRSGKWNLWCNWNFGRLNSKKIKVCGNRETGERSNVVQSKLLFDFNPPCQSQCWPKRYNFGQKVTMLAKKLQLWPTSYNFGQKGTLSFIKPKFQFSLNPLRQFVGGGVSIKTGISPVYSSGWDSPPEEQTCKTKKMRKPGKFRLKKFGSNKLKF